ncbi:MAG: ATP synthase F0 subunit B [Bdellovibrionota bacterium]
MHGLETLIAPLVNLLVLIGLMFFLMRKSVSENLQQRKKDIEENLKQSEELRMQAETRLSEVETKLHMLEKEVEEIFQRAKLEGEKQKQTIVARATTQAAQIIENAQRAAEREKQFASRELQKQLLSKAIEKSKVELKKTFTEQDHKQFVDHFVSNIEEYQHGSR